MMEEISTAPFSAKDLNLVSKQQPRFVDANFINEKMTYIRCINLYCKMMVKAVVSDKGLKTRLQQHQERNDVQASRVW